MNDKASSSRSMSEKIFGKGVDALFSVPVTPVKSDDTSTSTGNDDEHTEDVPKSQTPPQSAINEQLLARSLSTLTASEGVELSDDELMEAIDVPLGEYENMADVSPDEQLDEQQPQSTTDIRDKVTLKENSADPIDKDESSQVPTLQDRVRNAISVNGDTDEQLESDSVRPQSPFIRPPQPTTDEPTRVTRTKEEEARVLANLDTERIADLHVRIDKLYRQVPENVSNRPEITEEILGSLRQARTILIERPQDFVIAEYKVQQATTLYNRVENSEREADKYGWKVFWFEVISFVLLLFTFLIILAFNEQISNSLAALIGVSDPNASIIAALGFWSTFVWGGIGGVVGAMYILWTHVSQRQDFERQHVMWYLGQPVMGLILGGVTFLVINAGLLSLQGGEAASAALKTEVQFFPALIAFIAGFRPQFIFGMLLKIINVISPSSDSD